MLIPSRFALYQSASTPRMAVLEPAIGQQKAWGLGRIRVAWQHNGLISRWGSASGRLPSPWASSRSKMPAASQGIFNLIVVLPESVIWWLKGHFTIDTWQARMTSMVRNSTLHWMCLWRLAFTEGRIDSKKPRLERGNWPTLVCISSPGYFFCSSWWCVDAEDTKGEYSDHRSPPIQVHYNVWTAFFVEPHSFAIAYVDPDNVGKTVGVNNTQLFPWYWPGDNESTLLIITSNVDMTLLSIGIAAISRLRNPS